MKRKLLLSCGTWKLKDLEHGIYRPVSWCGCDTPPPLATSPRCGLCLSRFSECSGSIDCAALCHLFGAPPLIMCLRHTFQLVHRDTTMQVRQSQLLSVTGETTNSIKRADDKSVNKNKIKQSPACTLFCAAAVSTTLSLGFRCTKWMCINHPIRSHVSKVPGGLVLFASLRGQRESMRW